MFCYFLALKREVLWLLIFRNCQVRLAHRGVFFSAFLKFINILSLLNVNAEILQLLSFVTYKCYALLFSFRFVVFTYHSWHFTTRCFNFAFNLLMLFNKLWMKGKRCRHFFGDLFLRCFLSWIQIRSAMQWRVHSLLSLELLLMTVNENNSLNDGPYTLSI